MGRRREGGWGDEATALLAAGVVMFTSSCSVHKFVLVCLFWYNYHHGAAAERWVGMLQVPGGRVH